jgi:hypothetical protein
MSVIMLAGLGSFPVSGVLVHRLGPSPFFPVAAATVAIAVLGAMSQREFRDFGSAEPPEAELGRRIRVRPAAPNGALGEVTRRSAR